MEFGVASRVRALLTKVKGGDAHSSLPSVKFEQVFPNFSHARLTISHPGDRDAGVRPIELLYLSYLASHWQGATIFEFGTSAGRTTLNLALNVTQGGRVFSLDLPAGQRPPEQMYLPQQIGEICDIQKGSILQPLLSELPITLLEGESSVFDATPWQNAVDFVFVDGGHSWAALEADTRNARLMLREGGVIVWHDYLHKSCPEVCAFLDDLAKELPLFLISGTKSVIFAADEVLLARLRVASRGGS